MGQPLNELDRLKGSFLAIISHELCTPLTEIITATEILEGTSLNKDQRQCLEVIEHSALQLNKLIQDLISFAELQNEAIETRPGLNDLNQVALAAVDLYRTQMRDRGLLLVLRLAPDLPPLSFDRLKMLRVFSNLISNGVNFSREGGRIMVRTRRVGDCEILDVADTGVGIPREKQAHIFDGFYQVEDPLTRRVGGLGIGLAYARQLVEAHGGQITCESIEGQGSMFSVWLPVSRNLQGAGSGLDTSLKNGHESMG